jgi:SOS response regulatory protein OraA/RecX
MSQLLIKSIKKSPLPSRANVQLSDGNYLPLLIDDVIKLSLKKGEFLDTDRLNSLIQTSFSYLIKEYALKQIATSPKTKKLLNQKIFQKKYQLSQKYPLFKEVTKNTLITDQVVQEIENLGLLNDIDYAKYAINRHRTKSLRFIRGLLRQKGVNLNHLPDDIFSQIDSSKNIKKYLLKKFSKPQDLADFNTKNKFIGSMLRKGFTHSEVKTVIDDFLKSK